MLFAILLGLALSAQEYQPSQTASQASTQKQSHWIATEIPHLEMLAPSSGAAPDAEVATRLRAQRRVSVPLHSHPVDEQVRVIKGNLFLKIQGEKRHLHPGGSVLLKSYVNHSAIFSAGAEVELRGKGLLVSVWADPAHVKALKEDPVESNSERTKMKREQDKR
jgi:mannose-6-phosphate isomerase-like protein (cupin superfamily)